MQLERPSIAVFYHFFPPDDVVSAVLFGDLCSGLSERGWDVTVYPSVWNCHGEGDRHSSAETWRDVRVSRIWRPNLRQSSAIGRLVNSLWMTARWSLLALTERSRPDIVLVGTDPLLSLLVAPVWKAVRRETTIAHWCFDLYPEAAIADGLIPQEGAADQVLRALLRPAYRSCALIADLGPCMRNLLQKYPSKAERETFVPWALEEFPAPLPVSLEERQLLFGPAKLALLYSGSFGRAHRYEELLSLAKRLDGHNARMVFSARGNREAELRAALEEAGGIARFVPFAAQDKLEARLACADIHIVSLQPEWTGTVVPSKFFGALAAGRPILFAGSEESSIARWIRQYQLGWVLHADNVDEIAAQLIEYGDSPEQQSLMKQHCFDVYNLHFSRSVQLGRWNASLRSLIMNGSQRSGVPTATRTDPSDE